MKHPKVIYKITPTSAWKSAEDAGIFHGAAIDLADGFIHFSTAAQARETAAKHFAGQDNLSLVAVDAASLGEALKWEKSRNDDLFPHLYSELPMSAVLWVKPMPLAENGIHELPLNEA